MTDDKEVRNKILNEILNFGSPKNILIPGCGSKVFLQNEIAERLPDANILCTDYSGVIEVAKKQPTKDNIHYKALNSTNLGFKDKYDVVIIVNSILSESDEENRAILLSCNKSLKPGGIMLGYFPTIFASIDIAYLEPTKDRMSLVDIDKSSFYEEKQNLWQIFYTPLRLRRILKQTNFIMDKMEIHFCDSDYFTNQTREYYDITNNDLVIYEHFVILHKPKSD